MSPAAGLQERVPRNTPGGHDGGPPLIMLPAQGRCSRSRLSWVRVRDAAQAVRSAAAHWLRVLHPAHHGLMDQRVPRALMPDDVAVEHTRDAPLCRRGKRPSSPIHHPAGRRLGQRRWPHPPPDPVNELLSRRHWCPCSSAPGMSAGRVIAAPRPGSPGRGRRRRCCCRSAWRSGWSRRAGRRSRRAR